MQRRVVGQPVVGADAEGRRAPVHERERVAMGQHHTLGLAGRARGVEDVGQVRLDGALRRRRRREALQRRPRNLARAQRLPTHQHRAGQPLWRQRAQALGRRHQRAHAAVLGDGRHATGRRMGVERDVDGARLEHAQHGDDRLHRLREEQPHAVAALDAALAQQARELAGAHLQLRGWRACRGNDGRLRRRAAGADRPR